MAGHVGDSIVGEMASIPRRSGRPGAASRGPTHMGLQGPPSNWLSRAGTARSAEPQSPDVGLDRATSSAASAPACSDRPDGAAGGAPAIDSADASEARCQARPEP